MDEDTQTDINARLARLESRARESQKERGDLSARLDRLFARIEALEEKNSAILTELKLPEDNLPSGSFRLQMMEYDIRKGRD